MITVDDPDPEIGDLGLEIDLVGMGDVDRIVVRGGLEEEAEALVENGIFQCLLQSKTYNVVIFKLSNLIGDRFIETIIG